MPDKPLKFPKEKKARKEKHSIRFKPGVDTPRDVAIRNFEAQMNQDINDMRRGR